MPLTVRAVVDLSLLGAAVALLVASLLWRARYGLYLVGLALLGWEVGVLLDRALRPAVRLDLVGLGCGCLAAFTMRRLQVGWAGARLWLLLCGVACVALGLLVGIDDPWAVSWLGWPLLLAESAAIFAVVVVVGRRRHRGRRDPSSSVKPRHERNHRWSRSK